MTLLVNKRLCNTKRTITPQKYTLFNNVLSSEIIFLKKSVIFAGEMEQVNIKYMQEALVRDIIVRLCEDYGKSLPEAMQIVYSSETFNQLKDERTKLYAQSPVYVFDCLFHELQNGKIYV